ncbi:alkene reductase [Xanthovirga aplysinae]|uniref:alkene reductase n=1 Tax=Xanthovirga aplysinae TaxID=2529853 RepID=UPI0012BBF0F6|nr:alkene reductase [Xanthovirga aplysinae]MTI30360.1 alkene reductase [Xanthovirga aplysinae]
MEDILFSPQQLGAYRLPHRIIMAPLTRSRSKQPGNIPWEMNVEYYRQRSSAALIITEATNISPQGMGYALTPGIYSPDQINGWKGITRGIHKKGSKVFMQLWHVGRISHSSLQPNGVLPVAPSAIRAEGKVFTNEGLQLFETPRALEIEEMTDIVDQYRQAAVNAKEAGFDGVEIHAANGYLLEQFLKDGTNKRTDNYGGSVENRCRLPLEVVAAVTEVWGSDKVGTRISPSGTFNSMSDSNIEETFTFFVEQLNPFNLAYLHVVESFRGSHTNVALNLKLRKIFNGAYMANGGYNAQTAAKSITNGYSDFVSFGIPFIANPDLPERIKAGAPLSEADPSTYYGGNEKGYIDYPFMSTKE